MISYFTLFVDLFFGLYYYMSMVWWVRYGTRPFALTAPLSLREVAIYYRSLSVVRERM